MIDPSDVVNTTPHESNIFWISVLVYTVLSGLGSILIILSIGLKFRTDFSARLVTYLSMADLSLSIVCFALCAYNLSNGHLQDSMSAVCRLQAFISWYFAQSSILWLITIAINSYKTMFYDGHLTIKEEIIASVICWGVPVITAGIPLNRGEIDIQYGQRNGVWCSFSSDHRIGQIAVLLSYYIVAVSIICFCYVRIGMLVNKIGKTEATGSLTMIKVKAQRKMFLYCVSYFVCWTPMLISYIYEAWADRFVPFWAEYISANLIHIQGVLNVILYGITEDMIVNIRGWIKSKSVTKTETSSSSSVELPKMVE